MWQNPLTHFEETEHLPLLIQAEESKIVGGRTGRSGMWRMLAPVQEWICNKLYSPALSWKEYARAGCVCAGSLCWALQGSSSRWWEEMVILKTMFTWMNNYDRVAFIVRCRHHVCQKLAHLSREYECFQGSAACLSGLLHWIGKQRRWPNWWNPEPLAHPK